MSMLLKKAGFPIQVRSIDGSQVKEAQIVIVDTVTPGGRYPLGFVADKKPMNVALSRAQSGRIIISNARMADNTWASEATNLWIDLSREHKRDGGMWAGTVDDREIREEMAIPGPGICKYSQEDKGRSCVPTP